MTDRRVLEAIPILATCLLVGGCTGSIATGSAVSGGAGSAFVETTGVTGSIVSNPTATARPGQAVPRSMYVGRRWQLVTVRYQDAAHSVPASVDAWIRFSPTGALVMKDGVNASSGRFTSTTEGFRRGDMGTTLVGSTAADPVHRAVIKGMRAVLGLGSEAHRDGEVSIRMSSGRLILGVAGYELSFEA